MPAPNIFDQIDVNLAMTKNCGKMVAENCDGWKPAVWLTQMLCLIPRHAPDGRPSFKQKQSIAKRAGPCRFCYSRLCEQPLQLLIVGNVGSVDLVSRPRKLVQSVTGHAIYQLDVRHGVIRHHLGSAS